MTHAALKDLLPCPFCGLLPTTVEIDHVAGNYWHVVCNNRECGEVSTSGETEAEAITAWNRRAALSAMEGEAVAFGYLFRPRDGSPWQFEEGNEIPQIVTDHLETLPVYTAPPPQQAEPAAFQRCRSDAFGNLPKAPDWQPCTRSFYENHAEHDPLGHYIVRALYANGHTKYDMGHGEPATQPQQAGGDAVTELRICEIAHLFLKPNRLYRFTVDPNCAGCRASASAAIGATPPQPEEGGGEVLSDLASVLDAAKEASAVPLQWQASTDFTPEQAKDWLAAAVSENVKAGDFTGELHSIAELESGLTVAFTGCGPKSAANAKFLIWCAHFILKHGSGLTAALSTTPASGGEHG